MYAVIQSGGKQYKVNEGDILKVEKLSGEAGDKLSLDQVLIISDGEMLKVGSPLVAGAKVMVEVIEQGRGKKIT
ncbi:MAG: 50S ribosomal protein L21, partial [Syntrophomonas sp.]|nr:50S ribosomal protein L21 [Syntrophomonas sp.]